MTNTFCPHTGGLFKPPALPVVMTSCTIVRKCVHVFLLPAIRSIVIPDKDPESKVRSHNYIHSLSHGPKNPEDSAFLLGSAGTMER